MIRKCTDEVYSLMSKKTEPDFRRIGNRIRQVRLEKGLTQEFVANMAGVNSTHINNIENHRAKISLSTLIHVCNAMEVTVDFILAEEYSLPKRALVDSIIIEICRVPEDQLYRLLKIVKAMR